jgi:RES domain-containing protein
LLNSPPRGFGKLVLATRDIRADALFRISRHNSGEPFFGTSASYRFDDDKKQKARRFGTCYCGFDLETAIAETVLHDELPVRGVFRLSGGDFASRFLVRFEHKEVLSVADLTGISLKRLGGTGAISTIVPYELPQKWSKAVHRHSQNVDGILYMSRHLNDRPAVVVFSRAAGKFGNASYTPLNSAPAVAVAKRALSLTFPFP